MTVFWNVTLCNLVGFFFQLLEALTDFALGFLNPEDGGSSLQNFRSFENLTGQEMCTEGVTFVTLVTKVTIVTKIHSNLSNHGTKVAHSNHIKTGKRANKGKRGNISNQSRHACFFCPILTKLEFSQRSSVKPPNIKFHENPLNGSRVVPCGRTDGRDVADSRFLQHCEST
jgi:hypothetical protein